MHIYWVFSCFFNFFRHEAAVQVFPSFGLRHVRTSQDGRPGKRLGKSVWTSGLKRQNNESSRNDQDWFTLMTASLSRRLECQMPVSPMWSIVCRYNIQYTRFSETMGMNSTSAISFFPRTLVASVSGFMDFVFFVLHYFTWFLHSLMRFSSFFPPGLSASATSTASKELNGKRSTKTAGMVYVAPGLYLGNKQPGLADLGKLLQFERVF